MNLKLWAVITLVIWIAEIISYRMGILRGRREGYASCQTKATEAIKIIDEQHVHNLAQTLSKLIRAEEAGKSLQEQLIVVEKVKEADLLILSRITAWLQSKGLFEVCLKECELQWHPLFPQGDADEKLGREDQEGEQGGNQEPGIPA